MSSSKPSVSKKKSPRVVVVSWGDAFIETDDFSKKNAEETEPVYRKTVGFLIAKNQHGYVLATDTYDKEQDTYNAKMFIPLGMVTKIKYLGPR
jgi:hypothetical protein